MALYVNNAIVNEKIQVQMFTIQKKKKNYQVCEKIDEVAVIRSQVFIQHSLSLRAQFTLIS